MLIELYAFCRDNAVDAELHLKSDGRGFVVFTRGIDGARQHAEFDLERGPEHSLATALASVKFKAPLTDEERVRLETPR